jgi:hypothetical protein
MLGSSSSSPPRGAKVSSAHRPREARHDKTVGSSSCPVAPPARVGQRNRHSLVAEICASPDRSPEEVGVHPPAL